MEHQQGDERDQRHSAEKKKRKQQQGAESEKMMTALEPRQYSDQQ
jgi:hypothetical protein